jgi:hypothetical protein
VPASVSCWAGPEPQASLARSDLVQDVVYVALTIVLFTALALVLRAVEKL